MPIVTIRDIGRIGRAGNQMFLYCFCKAYAEKLGCRLECPDWFGRKIFVNATEPGISTYNLRQTPLETNVKYPLGFWFGQRDVDIFSYCQHQSFIDWFTRAQAREWLKLKPEYEKFAPHEPEPYSAAHIRRGDYQTDAWLARHYCVISDKSYEDAIERFDIPEPIYRVEEGWRTPPAELVKEGLSWLQDFLLLRDASHLLRANSSFSWWASVLGNGKTYAPVVGTKVGMNDVEFIESNAPCTAGVFRNQSDLHLKAL